MCVRKKMHIDVLMHMDVFECICTFFPPHVHGTPRKKKNVLLRADVLPQFPEVPRHVYIYLGVYAFL
jgi:hypothetical protein